MASDKLRMQILSPRAHNKIRKGKKQIEKIECSSKKY